MKKKSRILAALVLAMALLLTACGGMSASEAKEYAQSCLDACYKGEFDDYVKCTDSTKEEAQAMYEEGITNTLDASGLSDGTISQELLDKYEQLFIDLYKSANYTLAEPVEDGEDGYTIEVTIEPFTIFDGLEEELMTAVEELAANLTEIPTEDEINEMVYQAMYDLLAARVENMVYGDPVTVTLHVLPDEDGVYYIPEDDMVAIEEAMVPYTY